jgi:hypothetical protein
MTENPDIGAKLFARAAMINQLRRISLMADVKAKCAGFRKRGDANDNDGLTIKARNNG